MGLPVTAALKADQKNAMAAGRAMTKEAAGDTTLSTMDELGAPNYMIYVYNLLDLPWSIEQPPVFPKFNIAPCPKGERFTVTVLPPVVRLPFEKPGTSEKYYKNEDGRKAATSLLNPSAFPSTDWNSQLGDWATMDQTGNNLNIYGCFWSLTRPDDSKLNEEIKLFRARATKTMNELIKRAELLHASGKTIEITPMMHFAMDYLGKQATWHMSLEHMISCPNCGDTVKEGIAYHRNSFGDRCIIDQERYAQSVEPQQARTKAPKVVEREDEEEGTEETKTTPKSKKKNS